MSNMFKNRFSALDEDPDEQPQRGQQGTASKNQAGKAQLDKKPTQTEVQRQSSTRGRGGRGGRAHTGERGGKRNFSSEGRPPKREYDRRSGTGRGREVSKNGGGSRNWGNPKDTKELLDEAKIQNGEIPAAPAADNEENVPQVPVEEGPKKLSFEEYQKLEEEKRNNSKLFGEVETRKVTVPKNLKPLEKKEEVIIPPYQGGNNNTKQSSNKKNKHNKESNKQLLDAELLNFSTRGENDRSYSRGGRGGRGNYHNNGSRGGKGGRVQKVDTNGIDFPAL